MEYVLFPKTGGLQATLSLVRARQMIIHDITLGYVDFEHGQRTSELSLLKGWLLFLYIVFCEVVCEVTSLSIGRFPPEMHIFVDRYEAKDIPENEEDLKKVSNN